MRRWTYYATCVILRMWGVALAGLRMHANHHWPKHQGGLVCANHQSYLDPLLVGICCPRRMNFLARETLFRGPFGHVIAWYDAIPLQREGLGIGGIKESLRRLKRGELLLIFPEGTRTRDGQMQPLEPGFVALARRAKVPIIPLGIDGTFQAWPRSQRWPHPYPIRMEVGEPIPPEQFAEWDDQRLLEEVSRRMEQCWQAAHRRVERARHRVPSQDSQTT